jgi:hypothetical protein
LDAGVVAEEVRGDVFVSRGPNLAISDVVDVILVRVAISSDRTRWTMEDREDGRVDVGKGLVEDGSRLYGGGGDDGSRASDDVFGRRVTKYGGGEMGGDGRWWTRGRCGGDGWGDDWRDVLLVFERKVLDELVENGSVGGDVGEEVEGSGFYLLKLGACGGKGVGEIGGSDRSRLAVEKRRRRRGDEGRGAGDGRRRKSEECFDGRRTWRKGLLDSEVGGGGVVLVEAVKGVPRVVWQEAFLAVYVGVRFVEGDLEVVKGKRHLVSLNSQLQCGDCSNVATYYWLGE